MRQLNGCKVLWRKPKHGGDIDRRKPADRPVFDRTLMRGEMVGSIGSWFGGASAGEGLGERKA